MNKTFTNSQTQELQTAGLTCWAAGSAEVVSTDADGEMDVRVTLRGNCSFRVYVKPVEVRPLPATVLVKGKKVTIESGGPMRLVRGAIRARGNAFAALYGRGARGALVTIFLRETDGRLHWDVLRGPALRRDHTQDVTGAEDYAAGALADYLIELAAVAA